MMTLLSSREIEEFGVTLDFPFAPRRVKFESGPLFHSGGLKLVAILSTEGKEERSPRNEIYRVIIKTEEKPAKRNQIGMPDSFQ